MARLLWLAPVLVTALFVAGFGTFPNGATAWGAGLGTLTLLAMAGLAREYGQDPLRLGRYGRWLPLAVWLAVGTSVAVSTVPRAGWVGWILLPSYLLLPAAVERCWREPPALAWGLRGLAVVVLTVAAWALFHRWFFDAPRPAMPLGHHNLLATWLVTLLPLSVVPVRDSGPWRPVAAATGAVSVVTVFATGSFVAVLALTVQVATAIFWLGRGRPWARFRWPALLLPAVALVVFRAQRILELLRGADSSWQARWGYVQAGWEGFLKRPLVGWGPGSTAWTLAESLQPVPGVNPPGQVVSHLHALPLQIAYELGIVGFVAALGLGGTLWFRRSWERGQARDEPVARASLLGLLGGMVALAGGGPLSITALPVALGVAAGAGAASLGPRPVASRGRGVWVYLVVAGLGVTPVVWAQAWYDVAATGKVEPWIALERARQLDAHFPLYEARLAWLRAELEPGSREAARQGLEAARSARGLAPLWLAAGLLGRDAGEPWSRFAFLEACRLDPLGALAPFYLMMDDQGDPRAVDFGARALVAEPRLGAALFWDERQDLLATTLQRVASWPGVEPGWRVEFLRQMQQMRQMLTIEGLPDPGDLPTVEVTLEVDPVPSVSFSLFQFRRRPWPAHLGRVELAATRVAAITVPSPARLASTDPHAFQGLASCRSAEPAPQGP